MLYFSSGDVPRVDGQLAVARAFGDKSLKMHLSSEPDVMVELIDDDTELLILASDGVWKVSYSHFQRNTTCLLHSVFEFYCTSSEYVKRFKIGAETVETQCSLQTYRD